ncbi:MAG: PTS sugar transporter subunit IIB [Tissierellia bacterium]|nr:PTS sugar transporter subunit IIB [Tissierellia bacterium]
MKKITLFCAGGMSTSMLVKKMQQYCEKEGYEYEISAKASTLLKDEGKKADVILLGPQVRFMKDEASKLNVPFGIIDTRAYGMMDAKTVVNQARKLLGEI